MGLDIKECVRKDRLTTKGGTYYYIYYFKCSACGVEISSQHSYLKKHSGLCTSCSHKKGEFMGAYGRLVYNTKTRGISVDLTIDQFVQLCRIPNCHYCDSPINRGLKSGEKGYRGYFIDRKDNKIGYILDNCVPCCWNCNQAKGDRYSYEEFLMISRNLKLYREEISKPHWTQEFSWSDGDEITESAR